MKYFDQTTRRENAQAISVARIIYFILGILEMLLAFRFVFKLLGANPASPFVDFIYATSSIFIAPFYNIFPKTTVRTNEIVSVFEPETLIALIMYALLAEGAVRLLVLIVKPSPKVEEQL
jgi:hypothetical protein